LSNGSVLPSIVAETLLLRRKVESIDPIREKHGPHANGCHWSYERGRDSVDVNSGRKAKRSPQDQRGEGKKRVIEVTRQTPGFQEKYKRLGKKKKGILRP